MKQLQSTSARIRLSALVKDQTKAGKRKKKTKRNPSTSGNVRTEHKPSQEPDMLVAVGVTVRAMYFFAPMCEMHDCTVNTSGTERPRADSVPAWLNKAENTRCTWAGRTVLFLSVDEQQNKHFMKIKLEFLVYLQ